MLIYKYVQSHTGWKRHVASMGERRRAKRVLVGKPEEERSRRRWEDNIKMDLQEVGWGHGLH